MSVQNKVLDEQYGSHSRIVGAHLLADIRKAMQRGSEKEEV